MTFFFEPVTPITRFGYPSVWKVKILVGVSSLQFNNELLTISFDSLLLLMEYTCKQTGTLIFLFTGTHIEPFFL